MKLKLTVLLHAILCYFGKHEPWTKSSWSRCWWCYEWTLPNNKGD